MRAAFVDAVDPDWICPVCAAVCRDAETSVCCQQLACRRCVTAWFLVNLNSMCPLRCGSPSSRAGFLPTPYVDRRIRTLSIRCPLGCDAAGLVIGLKEQTMREHLDRHCSRRRILCPNRCRVSYTAQDEEQHLQRDCLNRPVSCRHGCDQLINPSDAYTHDRQCRNNCVPCPLVCFETAAQQTAAVSLPTSARRYYADRSSSVSAATASADSLLFDVLDSGRHWLVARTEQTKDARVLVHYEHWSSRWDEWLPVNSARIAPLNSHTVATVPPHAYNLIQKAAAMRPPSPSPAPRPLPLFSSPWTASAAAPLSRSRIQIAAVNDHLASVCPNRLKQPGSAVSLSLSALDGVSDLVQ